MSMARSNRRHADSRQRSEGLKEMRYQLMNADKVVAVLEERSVLGEYSYQVVEQLDGYLQYGFCDINSWIDDRQIAKHRTSIKRLMAELGMDNRKSFIDMVRCVSLTDTFWIRHEDSGLTWRDVSLYTNAFDDVVARIAFDGAGMYGRQFSSISPEFGTSGSFDKCWVREQDGPHLLKRGSSGFANSGFEPYSEKLCSDIFDAASVEHVPYTLRNYHGKLASDCALFTSEEIGFVPAIRMFDRMPDAYGMLSFLAAHGGEESFRDMLVMDAVCVNVDRHAGNYGFLVRNDTGEILGMAPLFDQNLALLPYLMEDDDLDEYLSFQKPKIGGDFTVVAKAMLTGDMRSRLVALKDFSFEDPGYGYPVWKLEIVRRLKDQMIEGILA